MTQATDVHLDADRRRDALTAAVARTAEQLLLADDWHEVVGDVVTRLGIAAEVSRAYVIENEMRGDEPRAVWRAEWTDEGVPRLMDEPEVRSQPWAGPWVVDFDAGRSVVSSMDALDEVDSTSLRFRTVGSIAAVPIMTGGRWLGVVGFDDRGDRSWGGPELDALDAAARLLAAAFARARRDDAARASERRYQALVETIPGVTYTDIPRPGELSLMGIVSPQIESILGYPPSRFTDDPSFWYDLIHPDDLERLRGADAFNASDPTPFDEEYRMRAADGRWVWVRDTSTAVHGSDGSVEYFVGFLEDITDRKVAEAQVAETDQRLRILFDNLPAIVYREPATPDGEEYDLDAPTWVIGPQGERILGYTRDEMDAPGFWSRATHPDDVAAVQQESRRTARTGENFKMDYRMIANDGRVLWFHDESALVHGPTGEPIEWQGIIVDVTALREAEQERAESEHRYRSLVDHTPDGILVRIGDRFRFANPRAAEIVGAGDPAALIGTLALDLIHPDDHEAVRARMAAVDERGEVNPPLHERFLRMDGTTVDVEVTGIPITWEGSRASLLVFRDISEQLAAEQQLRAAEARFRTIVEDNPAIIYTQDFDPDGSVSRTTYVSPRQADLLGYEPEEMMADPELWVRQIHAEDRERVLAADRASNRLRSGSFSMEYRMVARDGRVVWVHDQAEVVDAEDGRAYWLGFLIDVTHRKTAEEALRESNARLNEVVDTALDAVVSMNASGIITGWNPQAETTFGWSRSQALGRSLAETIVPVHMREAHSEGLRRYLSTGEGPVLGRRFELQALHRFGHEFPVEISIVPLRIGNEVSFCAFVRDISDRKRTEQEMERSLEVERRAAERLRGLDDMKNTFLQAVSHDLRTPLSAILGLAITLERNDVRLSPEETHDLAGRIAGNARRLGRLVSNLLDMDRLARGIVEPAIEVADVSGVIRGILDESGLVRGDRLHTDLPTLVAPIDSAKLERIVENLLANAARHTPPDSNVWVRATLADGGVLVIVEDDGPGIAPEMKEEIFEPFRQASDADHHVRGVGVGLALVRRFAELHGGRAWVEGREGGGASFRVWLPCQPVDVPLADAL